MSYRKTLIAPKTRLLLEVELHAVQDTPDYLSRLKKRLDYASEGHLRYDLDNLINGGLIQSHNLKDPPFSTTREGKDLLKPLLWTRRLAWIMVGLALYEFIVYLLFGVSSIWIGSVLALFPIYAVALLLYPEIVLKLGRVTL